MTCSCKIHYGAGKGGNRIAYCPLHESAPELRAALRESLCWLRGSGMSAKENGATCETLGDAKKMFRTAIARAAGEVSE